MKSRSKNSRSRPVLHLLATYTGETGWIIPRVKPWVLSEAILHVGEELSCMPGVTLAAKFVPTVVLYPPIAPNEPCIDTAPLIVLSARRLMGASSRARRIV